MFKKNRLPGFSIIEILLVILIIGILTAMISNTLRKSRMEARDVFRTTNIKQVQDALEMFSTKESRYPTAAEFVVGAPLVGPTGRTYMKQIPANPKPWKEGACATLGNEFIYNNPSSDTYSLSYCVARDIGDLSGGGYMATPNQIAVPYTFAATGGTVTYADGYKIHTFTTSGVFEALGSGDVEILVVAGGGGGGGNCISCGGAGGGGAGGLIYNTAYSVTPQSYSVVVGAGGAGGASKTNSASAYGANGINSSFDSLIAIGGGGGRPQNNSTGGTGGSGGGGSGGGSPAPGAGGAGTAGQGYSGGSGITSPYGGGGGGGAGAAGSTGSTKTGGIGLQYSISGSSVYYAGGGGGGAYSTNTPGTGGLGGGGNGANNSINSGNGFAGTANTGGGGGGANGSPNGGGGGAGGSGIVIIRYPFL